MHHPTFWLAAACVLASSSAWAQTTLRLDRTLYVQAGAGDSSARALVVGATQPWSSDAWQLGGGALRGHWDGWVGAWRNKDARGDNFYVAALGAGPSLRWRAQQGAAPWFVEAGTGVMFSNKHLYNSGRRMGARWNFVSHIGLGLNWGQVHEVSLRLQHASNAGLKNPNPGLNMVQLRYARAF